MVPGFLVGLFIEALEDASCGRGESGDVRHEVRRDVLGVAQQPGKGVGDRVVERVLLLRIGGLAEQVVHGRFGCPARLKLAILLENGVLGRFEDAVEAAQDDHGQHDEAILGRPVRPPEPVRDFPDLGLEFVVRLNVHR